MYAKLIKNEENYTVELSWYDPHGTREVKNVSLEMPEENEELDVRSAVYTPLLSTYYSLLQQCKSVAGPGSGGKRLHLSGGRD